MIKTLYRAEFKLFSELANTLDIGDVYLSKVSVEVAPSGLPMIHGWSDDNKQTVHLYVFCYWLNTGDSSARFNGFQFDTLAIYGYNLKDATKRLYRFLRLIALGESPLVALEVADNLQYERLPPAALRDTPHMPKKLPYASAALQVGSIWQAHDATVHHTRRDCESYMATSC